MITLIQNDPRVPAGRYGELLRRWGPTHRLVRLHAGDPLPEAGKSQLVIVLGGYMGVAEHEAYPFLTPLRRYLEQLAEGQVPLLAICLGGQLLAAAAGAEVRSGCRGERGVHRVELTAGGRLVRDGKLVPREKGSPGRSGRWRRSRGPSSARGWLCR